MNKYKKIAAAAVSVVMAGTMVVSLAACNKNSSSKKGVDVLNRFEGYMADAWQTAVKAYTNPDASAGNNQVKLTPKTDASGKLTYAANTTLNTFIGYDNADRGITFTSTYIDNLISYTNTSSTTSAKVYGVDYSQGKLKPAWNALAETLGITIADDYSGVGTDGQMEAVTSSELGLSGHQVFTASAANINQQGAQGNLLNITEYLDYMPNYKAFLDANPLVRLSLTADASGAMYMLPYFDGNDDIEKFVLLRKDFVEDMLDGDSEPAGTVTFAAQGAVKGLTTTSASAESFMGKVAADNYTVDVTDPSVLSNYDATHATLWGYDLHTINTDGLSPEEAEAKLKKTVKVTLDYGAALDAAKNEATGLGAAVKSAAGKVYTGDSGNIVDLQNFAINETNGAVTGAKLLTILREYVKVAYKDANGGAFYVGEGKKLSDVFNSAYAAWDVDLYTALGRCYVTCGAMFGDEAKETKDLYLLTGREYKAQRYNDTASFAGELYGVRGLESRYQYTYIKADGTLTDARSHEATYEALDKMSKLAKEGLYNAMTNNNITNGWSTSSVSDNKGVQALSLHDYVQTQTANAGFAAENSATNPYNLAPVLTPVSRWDTDDDGTVDTTMRFTESWRSVKNTGWCISYAGVKDNADKLSAALALVDYFFSNDGQILMTYGPQGNGQDASTADALTLAGGGFWYGNEITDSAVIAAATETFGGQLVVKESYAPLYFTYNNKLYTGEYYNGRQIPILTNSSLALFNTKGAHNFTNYARYYIGSALNIGNKDQGFEYQCTAKCGIAGSQVVNIALVNETIKHTIQQVPSSTTKNWYTLTPSLLPFETRISTAISVAPYTLVTGLGSSDSANLFSGSSSSGSTNLMIDIMAYGLGSGAAIRSTTDNTPLPDTAAEIIAYLNNL